VLSIEKGKKTKGKHAQRTTHSSKMNKHKKKAQQGGHLDTYWKQLEIKQEMKHSKFMKWNNCIN
jgi:hypothetical protein